MATNIQRCKLLMISFLILLFFPVSPLLSMENEPREAHEENLSKRRKLEDPVLGSENSQIDLHSFFHTHAENSECSTSLISGLYLSEDSSLTFQDWEKEFVDSNDDQLLKNVCQIFKEHPSNNILAVSVHARIQGALNTSWFSSPLYYDTENNEYVLSPKSTLQEENDKGRLLLSIFVDQPKPQGTQEKSSDLNLNYYVVGFSGEEMLLAEIKDSNYPKSFYKHPHTEIQALNILFRNKDSIFKIFKELGILEDLIIKFHTYNDVCEPCQRYLIQNQPFYRDLINISFKTSEIPFIFCGISNKPYGWIEYFYKDIMDTNQCQKIKPFSNWSYSRPVVAKISSILEMNPGISSQIEEYIKLSCDYGHLDYMCDDYKPYRGQLPLPISEKGEQTFMPLFIKRPTLSSLQGDIIIEESKRADYEKFANLYKLKLRIIDNISPLLDITPSEEGAGVVTPSRSQILEKAGPFEENQLTQLRGYREVYLNGAYLVFSEDSKYINKGSLTISPEIFNPEIVVLSLKVCGLEDNHIEQIGKFEKLKKLNLDCNKITDKGIGYLIHLKELTTLSIASNYISNKGLELLLKEVPSLTELDISHNKKVTDEIAETLLYQTPQTRLNVAFTGMNRENQKKIKAKFKVH